MKTFIRQFAAIGLLALLSACSNNETPAEPQPTPTSETWVAYPDFQLLDPDGKAYKLSSYKGKVIVLNFFATWCGPCQSETPELKTKIWDVYKDRNVVVVGIDLQETSTLVKQWAAQYGLTFPLLLDAKGEVGNAYQVNYIPHNVIIDKEFKVRFTQTGYGGNLNDLIAKIESLL
jgi:peroxiredoxin